MSPRTTALLACFLAAACGDEPATPSAGDVGGTVVVSAAADADALIPPLISQSSGRQVAEQIFDRLAEIGGDLNTVGDDGFTGALARSWTWSSDSLSIAFHLREDARWHDGRPVTAHDVRFTWELYTSPDVASPAAALLRNVDSVTVADSLTAVFWYADRTPAQFFETTYPLLVVPRHLLEEVPRNRLRESGFARNPVGSGRFRFSSWNPSVSLEVVSDTTNYRGRALLDRVIWVVAPDFNTAVTRYMSGEADVFEMLRPEQIQEMRDRPSLRVHLMPSLEYHFVQFNMRDPRDTSRQHALFADRDLRRALSMAVDRQAMVRNVFDTLAVVGMGPVTRALRLADTTVTLLPFDTVQAQAILDSLGWRDADGDGVRERGGRTLEFTLLVPGSSRSRVRMAVLIQEQLRRIGARVQLDQLEYAAFVERGRSRRFDAMFGAWRIDVGPHGIRQTWGSTGSRSPNGLNYGGYESAQFDAHVDSALAANDAAAARAHFRRAQETIIADAPAIWMFEPRVTLGLHSRLRTARIRPDAWWAGLADWSVSPGQRLPRDEAAPETASR
ncbi:MAG TPA: peptide ABC transporter substrate-binding protein [Gemmatimonadaceae bacterium]